MLYLSTITPAFRPWAGTRAGGKRGSVPSNLGRAIARATCGRGSVAHSCKDYTTCEQIKWGGSLPLSSVEPRCGKGTSLLHVLRLSFSEKLFSPTFLMAHAYPTPSFSFHPFTSSHSSSSSSRSIRQPFPGPYYVNTLIICYKIAATSTE